MSGTMDRKTLLGAVLEKSARADDLVSLPANAGRLGVAAIDLHDGRMQLACVGIRLTLGERRYGTSKRKGHRITARRRREGLLRGGDR